LGNIFVFCGAVYLISIGGVSEINILARYTLSPRQENIAFLLFTMGFACQIPLFPFHIWLPDSYDTPPTAVSIMFAGILSKISLFGMVTMLLPIARNAVPAFGGYVFTAAIVTAVYAAISALSQRDLGRVVSASSLLCTAIAVIGIFSFTEEGISGAIIHMTAHGFIIAALLVIIAAIKSRFGSHDTGIRGVSRAIPGISLVAAVPLLALASLPPLPGFVGNFLILFGCWENHPLLSAAVSLLTAFGAFLTFKIFFGIFAGECELPPVPLTVGERSCLLPMAALILLPGIFSNGIVRFVKHDVAVIVGRES
jgi:NADH-quinone oxidoreductase subunit M